MNEILKNRICKLIAMNYALVENDVWTAYQKLNSFDLLLNLIDTNQLDKIDEKIRS